MIWTWTLPVPGLRSHRRSRWTTIRKLVCVGIAIYVSLHVVLGFGMPSLSSKLPPYSGRYAVGLVDVEVPVSQPRHISEAVLKDTGEVAFNLTTVLFSLYYPAVLNDAASSSRAPRHPWLEKPISRTAEGYARFAKFNNKLSRSIFAFALWMLASSTSIPAHVDAPLHGSGSGTAKTHLDYEAEHPSDDYGLPRFPLIVFSHGIASSRTTYSQYCAEMASRGFIVAAIEHRDGSAPATLIHSEAGQKLCFNAADLNPRPELAAFKAAQLSMREAEVAETVRVLREINNGRGRAVYQSNMRTEGVELAAWRGRIMWDRIVMGGHSFGATLALQVLKEPSEAMPFVGAIVFDPGKHSGPLQDDINVPLVVVHSQSWSSKVSVFHGRPHFEVVRDLVKKVNEDKKKFAWFMTCKKSSHATVTDAPLVEPLLLSWSTGSAIGAHDGILQYVKISQQFLNYLKDGHRQSILREAITHHTYDDPNPRKVDPKIGNVWQIHVSPSVDCPAPGYCGLDDSDDG